jgi:hypothetical protein
MDECANAPNPQITRHGRTHADQEFSAAGTVWNMYVQVEVYVQASESKEPRTRIILVHISSVRVCVFARKTERKKNLEVPSKRRGRGARSGSGVQIGNGYNIRRSY